MEDINTLVTRLKKIGIEIELFANYPWIYLDKVNGNIVKEKFLAEHGFTIMFLKSEKRKNDFTNIGKMFDVIRKYK